MPESLPRNLPACSEGSRWEADFFSALACVESTDSRNKRRSGRSCAKAGLVGGGERERSANLASSDAGRSLLCALAPPPGHCRWRWKRRLVTLFPPFPLFFFPPSPRPSLTGREAERQDERQNARRRGGARPNRRRRRGPRVRPLERRRGEERVGTGDAHGGQGGAARDTPPQWRGRGGRRGAAARG